LVIMPEWQGIGVGLRFLEEVCRAQMRGENRWERQCFTLFARRTRLGRRVAEASRVAAARALRSTAGTEEKSVKSLANSREKPFGKIDSGGGYGGHLRAVHGFKFIGP